MRVSLVVEVGVDRSVCLNVCFFTFVSSVPTVLFLCSSVSLPFSVSEIRGSVGEFRPESCDFDWYSCSGPFLSHRAWFPSFPVFGGGPNGWRKTWEFANNQGLQGAEACRS